MSLIYLNRLITACALSHRGCTHKIKAREAVESLEVMDSERISYWNAILQDAALREEVKTESNQGRTARRMSRRPLENAFSSGLSLNSVYQLPAEPK